MKQELPKLPYDYKALEPYIDAETMELHYGKHHAGYVFKLNAALEKYPELQEKTLVDLLSDLNSLPEEIRGAVRNNGGGHFNHSLFWASMTPIAGEPPARLAEAIKISFGDFAAMKENFNQAATGLFGSGWTWLVKNGDNRLSIVSTPNQDTPLAMGLEPLLGIDVWEHAYYLKYQNRRSEYVENWWNVVSWEEVGRRYGNSN